MPNFEIHFFWYKSNTEYSYNSLTNDFRSFYVLALITSCERKEGRAFVYAQDFFFLMRNDSNDTGLMILAFLINLSVIKEGEALVCLMHYLLDRLIENVLGHCFKMTSFILFET